MAFVQEKRMTLFSAGWKQSKTLCSCLPAKWRGDGHMMMDVQCIPTSGCSGRKRGCSSCQSDLGPQARIGCPCYWGFQTAELVTMCDDGDPSFSQRTGCPALKRSIVPRSICAATRNSRRVYFPRWSSFLLSHMQSIHTIVSKGVRDMHPLHGGSSRTSSPGYALPWGSATVPLPSFHSHSHLLPHGWGFSSDVTYWPDHITLCCPCTRHCSTLLTGHQAQSWGLKGSSGE